MIDVVIPLFNKASKISRCLESVTAQKCIPSKIIVIDDGSTDSSRVIAEQVLAQYQGQYQIVTTKNNGVSAARNIGAKMADSPYIAFLDADDYWDEVYLQKATDIITKYSNLGVLSFFHRVKKGAKVFMPKQGVRSSFSGFLGSYARAARHGSPVNSSKVIVKKTLLNQIGGFPEGKGLTEDLYVWMRLSQITDFYLCNECLVTVDKGVDPDRPSRLDMQPYILEFFLGDTSFKMLNREEVKYLRNVYLVQSLYAIRHGKREDAQSRIDLGRGCFPLVSKILNALVIFSEKDKG
jgi:glycosyltransferase involved in cell wall biosynthesis